MSMADLWALCRLTQCKQQHDSEEIHKLRRGDTFIRKAAMFSVDLKGNFHRWMFSWAFAGWVAVGMLGCVALQSVIWSWMWYICLAGRSTFLLTANTSRWWSPKWPWLWLSENQELQTNVGMFSQTVFKIAATIYVPRMPISLHNFQNWRSLDYILLIK